MKRVGDSGRISYIPREGWEELPMNQLRQMKSELEKAERGERIFGVIWNDKRLLGALTAYGNEYLFASTEHRD